jgi:cysteine-rich repeat protein
MVLLVACGGPVKLNDNNNNADEPDAAVPGCGDGLIQEDMDEECDDGNEVDDDGCTECVIDEGYGCVDEPSECLPADLAVRITAVSILISTAATAEVIYEVANVGLAPTGPFDVKLWATTEAGFASPPDAPDFPDSNNPSLPSLDPGEVRIYSAQMALLNNATVAYVIVDGSNAIDEPDENNNFSTGYLWSRDPDNEYIGRASMDVTPRVIPNQADAPSLDVVVTVEADDFVNGYTPTNTWFSLNISHPDLSELEIIIESPEGLVRPFVFPEELTGAELRQTAIADAANINLASISDGSSPYRGEWDASGEWEDPNDPDATPGAVFPFDYRGDWILHITDTVPNENEGRLNGFQFTGAFFRP